MVHIFNPSTWEAETGGSLWVWGQPGLQSEFQDSQDYTEKPCLEKKQKEKRKKPSFYYCFLWWCSCPFCCCFVSHVLFYSRSLGYPVFDSWPSSQCQAWAPPHGVSFRLNQTLVDLYHKFCSTIALIPLVGRTGFMNGLVSRFLFP